jgi:hypothetical protein
MTFIKERKRTEYYKKYEFYNMLIDPWHGRKEGGKVALFSL